MSKEKPGNGRVKKITEGENKKKSRNEASPTAGSRKHEQRPLQPFLICLSCLSFPAQIQLHNAALHSVLHPSNLPFLEASDDRRDEWAPLASSMRKRSGPVSQDAGS